MRDAQDYLTDIVTRKSQLQRLGSTTSVHKMEPYGTPDSSRLCKRTDAGRHLRGAVQVVG